MIDNPQFTLLCPKSIAQRVYRAFYKVGYDVDDCLRCRQLEIEGRDLYGILFMREAA